MEATGYRIFLESYPAVKGVRGYVRPFDESLSIDVVERTIDVAKRLLELSEMVNKACFEVKAFVIESLRVAREVQEAGEAET